MLLALFSKPNFAKHGLYKYASNSINGFARNVAYTKQSYGKKRITDFPILTLFKSYEI